MMLTCLQVAFVFIDWWLCDEEWPKESNQKKRNPNRDLPVRLSLSKPFECSKLLSPFCSAPSPIFPSTFFVIRKSTQHQRQYSTLLSVLLLFFASGDWYPRQSFSVNLGKAVFATEPFSSFNIFIDSKSFDQQISPTSQSWSRRWNSTRRSA